MKPRKRSFFERLTGVVRFEDEDELQDINVTAVDSEKEMFEQDEETEEEEEETYWEEAPKQTSEAQLTIDLFETPSNLILKALVAGVTPDELDITITREMVTIRGERTEKEAITSDNYYHQELYWGPFSRTVQLPKEIDVEEAEAVERYGLLEIRLPKINKDREAKIQVRTG